MAATAPPQTQPGFVAFVREKRGPLPIWAWAVIVLVLIVGFMYLRRGRTSSAAAEYTTGDNSLPGDQSAPPIFIVPGGPAPTVNVPITVVDPTPTVPPAPPGGGSPPPKVPPKVPTPAPPRVKSEEVTVAKYTTRNAPWNSTLSGIWAKFKGKTTATNWQAIWNHPLNADLRKKRGAADRIQPWDKIYVPVK